MKEVLVPPLAAGSAAAVQQAMVTGGSVIGIFDPVTAMILGSVVGAAISVGVLKPPKPRYADDPDRPTWYPPPRILFKFGASFLCGLLFTPLFFRWYGISFEAAFTGPVSLIISAIATAVLHRTLPAIEERASSAFGALNPPKDLK